MITTIPLRISGDSWHDPHEFRAELEKLHPEQYVLIDVNSEGPALTPFGIYDILSKYSCNYIFTRWSNPVETMPYGRAACSELSHFFKLSAGYWINEIPNSPADRVLGLFVGRNSIARNYIIYDVYHSWQDKWLLSKMSSRDNNYWNTYSNQISVDSLENWADKNQQDNIKQWWSTNPITSIDSKTVGDQYHVPEVSAADCALSLLTHYTKFNVELVCETYTVGDTFFPTEKTIRPIVGNKPFLVYGPKHYLRNLQTLGFKTFSSIWNEQYDSYEGPARWQAMRPVIDMICKWDKLTLQAVLTQCLAITRHNRNRLKEIINDSKRV